MNGVAVLDRRALIAGESPVERVVAVSQTAGVLTTMRARKAYEVWTRREWIALAWHLHNDNSPFQWVIAFIAPNLRNGGRPEVQYRRARLPVERGISWAWSSLCGKGAKKIAYTPYSQNERQESRWGAVDFDAHGDDPQDAENARKWAFDFFRCALSTPETYLILEASGRGWHVWLICKQFRPVTEWIQLLSEKLNEAGIHETGRGIVECFPRAAVGEDRCGFAMRAPGSWHPGRNEVSLILWENLPRSLLSVPLNKRKRPSSSKREKDSRSSLPLSGIYPRGLEVVGECRILGVGVRHHQLCALMGRLFHQVGKDQMERLAREQFVQKLAPTRASEEEHLVEAAELWAGLDQRWQGQLGLVERRVFDALHEQTERDAFRIIRSYHTHATGKGEQEFAIVRDDLAGRLGMTGEGAGKLIRRLMEAEVIRRVREYVPHKFAARYAWRLGTASG